MAYQPPLGYGQQPHGQPYSQQPMGQPTYEGQPSWPQQQVMMQAPLMPVGNVIPTQSFGALAFLGSVPGLLIRQKTDWIGAVLDVAAHANRYQARNKTEKIYICNEMFICRIMTVRFCLPSVPFGV